MNGLVCARFISYRAETWALLHVAIKNQLDQQPWGPSEVTIRGMKSGVPLTVRAVEMDAAQTAPGKTGSVFVEVDPPSNGELLVLELKNAAGRSITIGDVDFSERESKQ